MTKVLASLCHNIMLNMTEYDLTNNVRGLKFFADNFKMIAVKNEVRINRSE